ncbi:flagellar filament capping protein FliD [Pseudoduganella sp. GCM10020061]|uniref:flagellar filament capping protein FliD n=1 Tax=Pseudoduganella sp. GCM10020061 TaxID=3317345 RepID=UPI003632AEFC
MGLSSAGIGSNLDIEGIISKLMSVEQQPLTKLARTEASYQAKLSGFGMLKGAMSAFQTAVKGLADPNKFQAVKAAVADTTIATASGSAATKPGTYSLEVSQLASSQKLVAQGQASDATAIGKGVITFDFGTITGGTLANGTYSGASFASSGAGVKTVTIDATNNSLAGIRDAINKAGIGVTAKIVNDGSGTPYRLSLTNEKTGAASAMKISVADTAPDTGLSALLNHDPAGTQKLSQTSAAQDAKFTVDGIAITKPTNSVSDVVDGLTLNLQKVTTSATSVTVTRDTGAIKDSINAFVKAYNEISANLRDSSAYDPATKSAAILNGEATVRNMQTQIRGVLSMPVAGGTTVLNSLSQAGVTMQKDGSLLVDSAKLDKAIADNFDDLGSLFAAVGKSTDGAVAYKGVSKATVPGSYAVSVTRMATQAYTTATAPAELNIDATNKSFEIMLNGVKATIALTEKLYGSAAELATEVQSKINSAAAISSAGFTVSVTESGGTLNIQSSRYGSDSSVTVTELGAAALNFNPISTNPGVDVAGTINGVAATGTGQTLTGGTGDPSEGLRIDIKAGTTGARGNITYSKGYAAQFDELATRLLDTDGPFTSRTNGINESIKSLNKNRQDLLARLATVEKRYRAQFTALDTALANMQQTSNYLAQQLSQIAAMSSSQ